MSDAVDVAIAKAVTQRIGAAVLSQQFKPERSYADWELKQQTLDDLQLQDSDKLHVDIVVRTTEKQTDASTRGKASFIVPVAIGIRKKFGADKQDDDTGRILIDEIDALCLLTQEIFLLFLPKPLADHPTLTWDGENGGTKILVCPNRQHLRELRQFTSVVTCTFKAWVDV